MRFIAVISSQAKGHCSEDSKPAAIIECFCCGFGTPCLTVFAVIIALVSLAAQGQCGIQNYEETTWLQKSESGNCVFVFIPPMSATREANKSEIDIAERIRIQSKYKVTGLYTTDDPPQLLWQSNIQTMAQPIYVSDNRKSLVIPGDFVEIPYPLTEDIIATFVDRGSISSFVRYADISRFLAIKRMLVPGRHLATKSSRFHAQTNEYIIETNVGERIVFDVATGKIKHYNDPIRNWTLFIGSVAAVVLLWLLFRICSRGGKVYHCPQRNPDP